MDVKKRSNNCKTRSNNDTVKNVKVTKFQIASTTLINVSHAIIINSTARG